MEEFVWHILVVQTVILILCLSDKYGLWSASDKKKKKNRSEVVLPELKVPSILLHNSEVIKGLNCVSFRRNPWDWERLLECESKFWPLSHNSLSSRCSLALLFSLKLSHQCDKSRRETFNSSLIKSQTFYFFGTHFTDISHDECMFQWTLFSLLRLGMPSYFLSRLNDMFNVYLWLCHFKCWCWHQC